MYSDYDDHRWNMFEFHFCVEIRSVGQHKPLNGDHERGNGPVGESDAVSYYRSSEQS